MSAADKRCRIVDAEAIEQTAGLMAAARECLKGWAGRYEGKDKHVAATRILIEQIDLWFLRL